MKEKLRRIAFNGFKLIFIVSIIMLAVSCYMLVHESNVLVNLASMVEDDAESTDFTIEIEETGSYDLGPQILAKYQNLYLENPDMAAWLKIEGTDINYPVMQTVDDMEYYIHKDFYGKYSLSGTPFVSDESSVYPPSDNIVVYGHNMVNGTMFAGLIDYETYDFYQEHKIINFDSVYEEREYEVVYVFYEDVSVDNGHFEFYHFSYAEDETDFMEFISNCSERSIYDTELEVNYGDELLTLVTCSHTTTVNGRFVVVAKRIV